MPIFLVRSLVLTGYACISAVAYPNTGTVDSTLGDKLELTWVG